MNIQEDIPDEQCRACGARIDKDDERVFVGPEGDGQGDAAYYHATCA